MSTIHLRLSEDIFLSNRVKCFALSKDKDLYLDNNLAFKKRYPDLIQKFEQDVMISPQPYYLYDQEWLILNLPKKQDHYHFEDFLLILDQFIRDYPKHGVEIIALSEFSLNMIDLPDNFCTVMWERYRMEALFDIDLYWSISRSKYLKDRCIRLENENVVFYTGDWALNLDKVHDVCINGKWYPTCRDYIQGISDTKSLKKWIYHYFKTIIERENRVGELSSTLKNLGYGGRTYIAYIDKDPVLGIGKDLSDMREWINYTPMDIKLNGSLNILGEAAAVLRRET